MLFLCVGKYSFYILFFCTILHIPVYTWLLLPSLHIRSTHAWLLFCFLYIFPYCHIPCISASHSYTTCILPCWLSCILALHFPDILRSHNIHHRYILCSCISGFRIRPLICCRQHSAAFKYSSAYIRCLIRAVCHYHFMFWVFHTYIVIQFIKWHAVMYISCCYIYSKYEIILITRSVCFIRKTFLCSPLLNTPLSGYAADSVISLLFGGFLLSSNGFFPCASLSLFISSSSSPAYLLASAGSFFLLFFFMLAFAFICVPSTNMALQSMNPASAASPSI